MSIDIKDKTFSEWLNESKKSEETEKKTKKNKKLADDTKEPVKFKKKPVVIDAMKWTGENFEEVKKFAGKNVKLDDGELIVITLEDGKKSKAKHAASNGDYVIKGVQGEFYFCKPDIFKDTYERVDDEQEESDK